MISTGFRFAETLATIVVLAGSSLAVAQQKGAPAKQSMDAKQKAGRRRKPRRG